MIINIIIYHLLPFISPPLSALDARSAAWLAAQFDLPGTPSGGIGGVNYEKIGGVEVIKPTMIFGVALSHGNHAEGIVSFH